MGSPEVCHLCFVLMQQCWQMLFHHMSEDDEINFYPPWASGLEGKGLKFASHAMGSFGPRAPHSHTLNKECSIELHVSFRKSGLFVPLWRRPHLHFMRPDIFSTLGANYVGPYSVILDSQLKEHCNSPPKYKKLLRPYPQSNLLTETNSVNLNLATNSLITLTSHHFTLILSHQLHCLS